jgi:hypothetical protein
MKRLTPLRAIKFCIECCIGLPGYVEQCDTAPCPLHAYRLGKQPKQQKSLGSVVISQTENDEASYEENIPDN